MIRLAQLWQELQQTGISVARLGDILNTRPENANLGAGRAQLPAIRGEITFDAVRFRYRPDGSKTLRGIDFVLRSGAPMDAVIHSAKLAGAHEFILELPEGYDTLVGEQGATLSGGQRQRIAIALALITNQRILIFDEATSSLDYESERIIADNMRFIAKGRTVIVIAHRLSAVRDAHRILVLEQGELVEQGTHAELVKRPEGRYARLHALQMGAV